MNQKTLQGILNAVKSGEIDVRGDDVYLPSVIKAASEAVDQAAKTLRERRRALQAACEDYIASLPRR